jgi:cob(I)alamin adenosyltransferase
MTERLARIYTRTGDDGSTGLADGSRTRKDAPRIEAIGAVDELNSLLGLLRTNNPPEPLASQLTTIQRNLFELGADLAVPNRNTLDAGQAGTLETDMDDMNRKLPPLQSFILPGGSPSAALCHQARAVCRRAERRVVALEREIPVNPGIIIYLNRLSDYLFVLARTLVRVEQGTEHLWQGTREAHST